MASSSINPASPSLPLPPAFAAPQKHPWYSWRRLGMNFLTVSILAHLIFGIVGTYLIVKVIQPTRKQTFDKGAGTPNSPTRALEHKVSMNKKRATMSAPPAAKRITVDSPNAKVALPAMAAMPRSNVVAPATMASMAGSSAGLGMGVGGAGGGGGGGGGGGLNFFGMRTGGNGLTGTFYDLKQTQNKQPTGMDPKKFAKIISDFAKGGFNLGLLSQYFKAPKPLYATQLFTPSMNADLGPAAFQMEKEVQPKMWLIHYQGTVSPPADGTYSFVGLGDDYLLVKFNNKLVLDGSWQDGATSLKPRARYSYPLSNPSQGGIAKGEPITVQARESYPIEIVIAEQPGGVMIADLLIEQEGVTYKKDAKGNPILPIFRLANSPPLPAGNFLPHAAGGPVWKSVQPKLGSSVFGH
jgi:hypothetical protein